MAFRMSLAEKTGNAFIHVILALSTLTCLAPLMNVLAVSFSSRAAAEAGWVGPWPVGFSLSSYRFILTNTAFLRAFLVSAERVVLGTAFDMLLIVLTAYPLSKDPKRFRMRTPYAWIFLATILFSGGLIPAYMTVRATGLINRMAALILPAGVSVFHMVLMLNFFRSLPKEMEEAAEMDGAGHVGILFRIFLPLSPAALATLTLFTAVGHWNAWFDGMIYMNSAEKYPLQTYLQSMLIKMQQFLDSMAHNTEAWQFLDDVSDRTARAAQIFVAALPIIAVYPFLQRYFIRGVVLGSVKE
jgi:putative aldouronate transport system permease protein